MQCRTRRARRNSSTVVELYRTETLEARKMLSGVITGVTSPLDGFRFIFGNGLPSISNTYTAAVSGAVTRVDFTIGGTTVSDNSSADGWRATINMSSLTSDTDLLVRAFHNGIEVGAETHPVSLLALPAWLRTSGALTGASTVSAATGYSLDVYLATFDHRTTTPSNWDWTPTFNGQQLSRPIIQLAGKENSFTGGWSFKIVSSPSGAVSTNNLGFNLSLKLLGNQLYSQKLNIGTSVPISIGQITGSANLSFAPNIGSNLSVAGGLSTHASISISVHKEATFPTVMFPAHPAIPAAVANLGLTLKAGFHVGVQAQASGTLNTNGAYKPSSATFTLDTKASLNAVAAVTLIDGNWLRRFRLVQVGLDFFEINASNLNLARAYVGGTGTVEQSVSAVWTGSDWTYTMPGSLKINGEIGWDAFGAWAGQRYPFDVYERLWNPAAGTSVHSRTALSPPTLRGPGTPTDVGSTLSSLTPTFQWDPVPGARTYGLYISEFPYGYSRLVFDRENVTGTSLQLPPEFLEAGKKYRWNMQAFGDGVESGFSTAPYFTTPGTSGSGTGIPSAAATSPDVSNASASDRSLVTVQYVDDVGIDISTIGSGDLLVTGPNSFSAIPSLYSLPNNSNGSPRQAIYALTPPGGSWNAPDNGIYQIAVVANQVKDLNGLPVPAGVVGSFTVTRGTGTSGADIVNDSFETASQIGRVGEQIQIRSSVRNDGSAIAPPSRTHIYLSKDSTITTADHYLGEIIVPELDPGEETTASLRGYTLPAGNHSFWQGDGTYWVGAIADATGVVAETNEANNSNTGGNDREDITVSGVGTSGRPDFELPYAELVTTTSPVRAGDLVTVRFRVENDSVNPAGASVTTIELRNANDNVTFAEVPVPALAPGAQSQILTAAFRLPMPGDYNYGPPQGVGDGTYTIRVEANGNHAIDESYTGDNWQDLTVNIADTAPATGPGPSHVWSSFAGGSATTDSTQKIALAGDGSVYVVGGAPDGVDWISGGDDTVHGGGYDDYLLKLSADGAFLWATLLGGPSDEGSFSSVTIGADGSIYVGGITRSALWTAGSFDNSLGGASDGYVAKFAPNGQRLWSRYVGGSGDDAIFDVKAGADGSIYAVGSTTSPGFAIGGADTVLGGIGDGFLVRLESDGFLTWSTYIGGSDANLVDTAYSVDVDETSVVVTGRTGSAGWTAGGYNTEYRGNVDVYVAKFAPNGNPLWSTYVGGSEAESAYSSIALGPLGEVYVLGGTQSAGWVSDALDEELGARGDTFFLVKLGDGGTHTWSTYLTEGAALGSSGGASLDLNAAGEVVFTAAVGASDWAYPTGDGRAHGGITDVLVAKLTAAGVPVWHTWLGGQNWEVVSRGSIALGDDGIAYVTGIAEGPWAQGGWDTQFDGQDGFIAKLIIPDNQAPLFLQGTASTDSPTELLAVFNETVALNPVGDPPYVRNLSSGLTFSLSDFDVLQGGDGRTLGLRYKLGQLPTGSYRATFPAASVEDHSGNLIADDITFTFSITDTVAPAVTDAAFRFDDAQPNLSMVFSEDVAATLTASDLLLVNLTTGQTVPVSHLTLTYSAATRLAVFTYTGNARGIFPDGAYRATLPAGSVTDPVGNPTVDTWISDFFVLAGDANRDRVVNFDDLLLLAQNYGQSGKSFSGGNFNYSTDGRVDFDDLLLLAQRYGQTVISTSVSPNGTRARRRVADGVL